MTQSLKISLFAALLAAGLLCPTPSHALPSLDAIKNVVFGYARNDNEYTYMGFLYFAVLKTFLFPTQTATTPASERITQLINAAARERGLKATITCVINPDTVSFEARSNSATILINPEWAAKLDALVRKQESNQPLTQEEEDTYYYYVAAANHELTHVERNSSFWCLMIPLCANYFIFSHLFKYSSTLWRITYSLGLTALIDYLYLKYDEYKADMGIPRKKKLLEAMLKFHMKSCAHLQKIIDDFENGEKLNPTDNIVFIFYRWLYKRERFDRYPILYELLHINDTHPSSFFLAPYFKAKLATISDQQN
jgi:hypothetical protein